MMLSRRSALLSASLPVSPYPIALGHSRPPRPLRTKQRRLQFSASNGVASR